MDRFIDTTNPKNAVMQIQQALRDIQFYETGEALIAVDGNYDDTTRQAVKDFQSKHFLEPTGIVDYDTWEMIRLVYERVTAENAPPRAVHIFPKRRKYELHPGARDNIVFVIQMMLVELRQLYDEFANVLINGVYDYETEKAIRILQAKNLLPETGILDSQTWNRLADEYEKVNEYSQ